MKATKISLEFYRYLFVGGMAFLFDYSIVMLCQFRLHYLLATACGFISGTLVNYMLSKRFVFTHSKLKRPSMELLLYVLIGALGLALTQGLIFIFTGMHCIPLFLSRPIVSVLVLFINFILRKFILF